MDYVIALVATPLLMVVWVLIQRWAADDANEDSIGRCVGCTCGRGLESCEREREGAVE